MEINDNNKTTLLRCFDTFNRPEILSDNNQWLCPNCNTQRDAEQTMSLYKTSKYLIIHLKRFKQKNNYRKVKIDNMVEFPLKLNLADHLANFNTPMDNFSTSRILNPPIDRTKA
jgi:ubiquitin C-terminal hydrolase